MFNQNAFHVKQNWKDLGVKISTFQKDEKFTDIDLLVDEQVFRGHKVILASASPYFETMFSTELSEKGKTAIEIHGLTKELFSLLFDYIYRRQLQINEDNVQEILGGSNMLQLTNLTTNCCEFLKTKLNEKNVVGIYRLADMYSSTESLLQLKRDCKFFIEKHFLKIIESEEFIELPFHLFENLLKSESLNMNSELDVFQVTLRWVLKEPDTRLKLIYLLMKYVRLPIIPEEKKKNLIENVNHNELQNILIEITKQNLQTENIFKKPRYKNSDVFYLIGGLRDDSRYDALRVSPNIIRFDAFNFKINSLKPLQIARFNHQSVALDGLLYIAGGSTSTRMPLKLVESFDLYENKKVSSSYMLNSRQDFGLINHDGFLLAIGGSIEKPNLVERYDSKTNHWSEFHSISELPIRGFRTVKIENKIYIIGGVNSLNQILNQTLCYDPQTGQVKQLSPMNETRASFGCVYAFKHIYVVGGSSRTNNRSTAERYDLKKNIWTSISDLDRPLENCSVTICFNKLLVLGGQNPNSGSLSKQVYIYDPEINIWTNYKNLPFRISGASLISIADLKF